MPPTRNSPNEAVQYLSVKQVLATHGALIKRYGGTHGVREHGLLESAVFRPQASAFGQDAYPALFEKYAVLMHSLVKNHPFVDGNKRTGFAAMHLMLLINGYDLNSSVNNEVTMAENVASGKMDKGEIVLWLKKYTKKKAQ